MIVSIISGINIKNQQYCVLPDLIDDVNGRLLQQSVGDEGLRHTHLPLTHLHQSWPQVRCAHHVRTHSLCRVHHGHQQTLYTHMHTQLMVLNITSALKCSMCVLELSEPAAAGLQQC